MKDNFNDITSEEIQDKQSKLNEILNSVDSKLKPENRSLGWEDKINSVLEKHSHNDDVEAILNIISAEPEKPEPIIEKTPEKAIPPENETEELVEQITVGKKVAELSQQKKSVVEEVNEVQEVKAEDIIKESVPPVSHEELQKKSVVEEVNEVQEVKAEDIIKKSVPPVSHEELQEETPTEEKGDTIIYNVPTRKASVSVVRQAMAESPVAEVRKPVKKIVRVENNNEHEPVKPVEDVKKSSPEHKPIKKQPEIKKKKSMKEKFLDLFPKKEDPTLEKIRKVVFMCSIIAIVVCGYMVGDYYIDLGKSKNLHEEIASIYEPYHPPIPAQNVATIYEPDYEREYTLLDGARKLLDMNPDVVGYITIPDTLVANPVMQSGDNEKYLDQNINGDTSRAGELFLDYRNNFDRVVDGKLSVENSDNLVIYGHNMGNDTMFGCLKFYQRNYGYYSQHPIIYLNSNYECYTYKIFSYFILDAMDSSETAYDCWNKFDFDGEEDFYNFVNEAKKRSLALNDVDVKYGDKLLTLSTCNPILGDRGRLIVMARLLRDGEDALQGTEKSVQNTNIKWPSIYYQQKPNERYNPDAEFIPYG